MAIHILSLECELPEFRPRQVRLVYSCRSTTEKEIEETEQVQDRTLYHEFKLCSDGDASAHVDLNASIA